MSFHTLVALSHQWSLTENKQKAFIYSVNINWMPDPLLVNLFTVLPYGNIHIICLRFSHFWFFKNLTSELVSLWKFMFALECSPLLPIRRVKILGGENIYLPPGQPTTVWIVSYYRRGFIQRCYGWSLGRNVSEKTMTVPGPSLSSPEMGVTVNNSNIIMGYLSLVQYCIPPAESMIPNQLKPITTWLWGINLPTSPSQLL